LTTTTVVGNPKPTRTLAASILLVEKLTGHEPASRTEA
jgi:hypothetical protein